MQRQQVEFDGYCNTPAWNDGPMMMLKIIILIVILFIPFDVSAQSSSHFAFELAARWNGAQYSGPNEDEVNDLTGRSLGYGIGISVLHKFSPNTAIKFGMLNNQRGWTGSDSSISFQPASLAVDYLDFPLTIHQFFPIGGGERSIRPFAFVGAEIGFLLSDDPFYMSIHNISLLFGAGVEVPLSRTFSIDVGLGYERAVTTIHTYYGGESRFNSFVGSASLRFAM